MTIFDLDEILKIMNWDEICEKIKKYGFREAEEGTVCEFDIDELYKKSKYHKHAIQKDEAKDKEYFGTLYKNCKQYEGLTFISITLFVIRRDHDNISVPQKSILLTDAPYNKEFVEEMNSICVCPNCGKTFVKKDMSKYKQQFFCINCYMDKIDKEMFKDFLLKKMQIIINGIG